MSQLYKDLSSEYFRVNGKKLTQALLADLLRTRHQELKTIGQHDISRAFAENGNSSRYDTTVSPERIQRILEGAMLLLEQLREQKSRPSLLTEIPPQPNIATNLETSILPEGKSVEFRASFWAASFDGIWDRPRFFFMPESRDKGRVKATGLFMRLDHDCEGWYDKAETGRIEIQLSQPGRHSAFIIAYVNHIDPIEQWDVFHGLYLGVSASKGNPITVRPIIFFPPNADEKTIDHWNSFLEAKRTETNWWKFYEP